MHGKEISRIIAVYTIHTTFDEHLHTSTAEEVKMFKAPTKVACLIFVGNLASDTMVSQHLPDLFTKFGPVSSCVLLKYGFGFILFQNRESAAAAANNSGIITFKGKLVDVHRAILINVNLTPVPSSRSNAGATFAIAYPASFAQPIEFISPFSGTQVKEILYEFNWAFFHFIIMICFLNHGFYRFGLSLQLETFGCVF